MYMCLVVGSVHTVNTVRSAPIASESKDDLIGSKVT